MEPTWCAQSFIVPYISQDHISTMELEGTPSGSDTEGESP